MTHQCLIARACAADEFRIADSTTADTGDGDRRARETQETTRVANVKYNIEEAPEKADGLWVVLRT